MNHFIASVCFALSISITALADDTSMAEAGDIMIHDSWARASIGKAPNSAAYMILMTHGTEADKLIGVATPAAERAELHTHVLENDIAKMRPIEAIEIAPGEPAVMEPGSLHVMLMGLKGPLEEGSKLPLTLTFEHAGEVTVDVPIVGIRGPSKESESSKHTH